MHKIYIGDHPTIENQIDGTKVKPEDTKFITSGVLVFYSIPRKLNKYLKYCKIPIYILLQDNKKVPYQLKTFEIIQDDSIWNTRKFVEHIFFNPDRQSIYKELIDRKPPVVALFSWIKRNVLYVYDIIPDVLYRLDEQVVKRNTEFFYVLVCFGLKPSTNVVRLRWK